MKDKAELQAFYVKEIVKINANYEKLLNTLIRRIRWHQRKDPLKPDIGLTQLTENLGFRDKAFRWYIQPVIEVESLYKLGLSHASKMEHAKAINIFDEIINKTRKLPSNQDASTKKFRVESYKYYFIHLADLAKVVSLIEQPRVFSFIKEQDYSEALTILEALFSGFPKTDAIFSLKAKIFALQNNYEAMHYYFLADYFHQFPLVSAEDFATLVKGDSAEIGLLKEKHKLVTTEVITNRLNDFEQNYSTTLKNFYLKKLTDGFGKLIQNEYSFSKKVDSKISKEIWQKEIRTEVFYYLANNYATLSDEIKIKLLGKINPKFSKYAQAQFELYEIFLVQKKISQYTDLAARQKDIHKGLESLLNAVTTGHLKAQAEARKYGLKDSQAAIGKNSYFDGHKTFDIKNIEVVTKKIWVDELKALVPGTPQFAQAQYQIHNHYLELALNIDLTTTLGEKTACIRAVFEYLIKAKLTGNVYTRGLQETNEKIKKIPLKGFQPELQEAIDAELCSQLLRIKLNSPAYYEAQRILFEIYYYSRPNYINYESDDQRLKDIKQALGYLAESNLLGAQKRFKEASTKETFVAAIPEMATYFLDEELSIINFEAIFGASLFYKGSVNTYRKRFKTSEVQSCSLSSQDGFYFIELEEGLLNSDSSIRYVDGDKEIAYLEFSKEHILLKGRGSNIHLGFNEITFIHQPVFKIQNPEGKVKLKAEFDSRCEFYLYANAQELHFSGGILAMEVLVIETDAHLFLNEGKSDFWHCISSCEKMSIKAASLTLGGLLSSDSLVKIEAKDFFEALPHSWIKTKGDFILVSDNIKSLEGKIKCSQNMFLEIKHNAFITSQVKVKGQLTIHGDRIENYKELKGQNVVIEARDALINHKNALIESDKILYLYGGSGWNAGKIKFGEQGITSLNKFLVHGIASVEDLFEFQLPENLEELTNRPCIWGGKNGEKSLNVIAGGYINIFGQIKAPFTLCTIFEFDAGLTVANYSNRTALISVDLGIHVPNFEFIFDSLRDYISSTLTHLENRNFSAIAENTWNIIKNDILTARNFITLSAVTRTIARLVAPKAVSKSVDIAWSLAMLTINIPAVFNHCIKLSEQKRPIEPRDLYFLIGFVSSFANQVMQLDNQLESLAPRDNLDFNRSPSADHIALAAIDLFTLLGPSEVDTSLVKLDAGVHLSGTVTHQAIINHSNSLEVAANYTDLSLISDQEKAVIANNVLVQGERSQQNSALIANQVYMEVNELSQKGKIIANEAQFSGQQLDLAADLTVQKCTVTADTLTVQAEIQAEKVKLEARDLNLDAKVSANESSLAAQNLNLQQQATLESKSMNIEAKTVSLLGTVNTEQLVIHAADLDANKLVNEGYENITVHDSLVLKTQEEVRLTETNPQINLAIIAPHIELKKDLQTEKDLLLEETQGDLNLNVDLVANNTVLMADQGEVNIENKISVSNTLFVDGEQGIHNSGELQSGNQSFLHSQYGNIDNTGKIAAAHYLQVEADGGSINNVCNESDVRGPYDWLKAWQPAEMRGGDGENTGSLGLAIYAQKEVKNDASVMAAKGDVAISGEEGVKTLGRSHAYTPYYKHTRTWYGKEDEKIEVSVQVKNPIITSEAGQTRIESSQGSIYSLSTEFTSKTGTLLHAKSEVTLTGTIKQTRVYHSHDNFFGLTHEEKDRRDDFSVPTYVLNKGGNTTIIADEGDVSITNASIITPEELSLVGRNITLSTPILNYTRSEFSRDLSFNYPLIDKVRHYAKGDFSEFSSLTADLSSFSYATNPLALGLNTLDTLVDGAKETKRLFAGLSSGNLLSLFNLDPTEIHLGCTVNRITTHYQNVAANIIHAGSLTANVAESLVMENGLPIVVDNNAQIKALHLRQAGAGATLESSLESSNAGLSLDLGLAHSPQVSLYDAETSTQITHHLTQVIQVGGELTVQADDWQQQNATVQVGKLEKEIRVFSSIAEEDHSETRQWTTQIDSTGMLNFSKSIEKTSGTKTERSIYRTNLPFFFKPNPQQSKPAVVEEVIEDVLAAEVDVDFPASMEDKGQPLVRPGAGATLNNAPAVGNESFSLCQTQDWTQSCSIEPTSNDLNLKPQCGSNTTGEQVLDYARLFSNVLTTIDKTGLTHHINTMVTHAADVYDYCNTYDTDLQEGKTSEQALEDVSADVFKSYLENKTLPSIITRLGADPLIYPLAALQAELSIIANNKEMVDEQLKTVEASIPAKSDIANYPFWAKATIYHNHEEIEQKRELNNVLGEAGALISSVAKTKRT